MRGDIEKTGKGANREAAVVTASEIARMKQAAHIQTATDKAAARKIQEEQKA